MKKGRCGALLMTLALAATASMSPARELTPHSLALSRGYDSGACGDGTPSVSDGSPAGVAPGDGNTQGPPVPEDPCTAARKVLRIKVDAVTQAQANLEAKQQTLAGNQKVLDDFMADPNRSPEEKEVFRKIGEEAVEASQRAVDAANSLLQDALLGQAAASQAVDVACAPPPRIVNPRNPIIDTSETEPTVVS